MAGAEQHPVKDGAPRRLGTVLGGCAHDLDDCRVDQQGGQTIDVAGVERGDERVQRGGHGRGLGRGNGVVLELAATAVQRRLDTAHRGAQRLGDLLERQVEDVLEHDRRPLLRR